MLKMRFSHLHTTWLPSLPTPPGLVHTCEQRVTTVPDDDRPIISHLTV